MSFTDFEEEKLIEYVFENPVLYDLSHSDYRNSLIKDNVWKNIGNELNKSEEDCKKKWKGIRDGYQRFKKKQKGNTWSCPKNSKDKRHSLLTFLDGIPPHTIADSNVSLSQQILNEEEEIIEEKPEYLVLPSIDHANYPVACEVVKAKKKIIKQPNRQFMKLMRQRKEQRNTQFQTITKKKADDVDLFCGHLAEVLRNLPPVKKAKAKQHLYNVLSKYEIMAAGDSADRESSSNYDD